MVSYSQKRLEKWQVLYEPGHELPVDPAYDQLETAVLPASSLTKAATTSSGGKILKNKDGSTQALTEEMLRARKAPRQMAVIYVDDLLIVTASYATHVRALKRMLKAIKAENMFINSKI
eukprot:COSAG01_NODE_3916_length_5541_cov_12.214994_1_plen_119_part_00